MSPMAPVTAPAAKTQGTQSLQGDDSAGGAGSDWSILMGFVEEVGVGTGTAVGVGMDKFSRFTPRS